MFSVNLINNLLSFIINALKVVCKIIFIVNSRV